MVAYEGTIRFTTYATFVYMAILYTQKAISYITDKIVLSTCKTYILLLRKSSE